jgi:hypothetical protein
MENEQRKEVPKVPMRNPNSLHLAGSQVWLLLEVAQARAYPMGAFPWTVTKTGKSPQRKLRP